MSLPQVIDLAAKDLKATAARSSIAAAGIALGVGVLLIVAGLGLGARDVVLKEVVRALPVDMVEVVPRSLDLGFLKTATLFGGARLDATTLARLQALPEVGAAYPRLDVRLPLGARGGERLFGRALYTDLFMLGLPEELVGDPKFADGGDVIPVVISDQLIEVYNSSVAASLGTPQLTSRTLEGFEFDIIVGRSLMLGNRGARQSGVERGRIVGVSPYAMRLGASVPLATARRLLRKYGQDPGSDDGGDAEERYGSVLLRLRSAQHVPAVVTAVRAMGLDVDETAERTGDIMSAATGLASLIGILVLALAALNIAHSFFASLSERRRDLAVLRAIGARRTDLLVMVQAQAVMLGCAGAIVGIGGAHVAAVLIDQLAATLLPAFPFKPETFFSLPLWLDAAGLAGAIIAACAGAAWPAWWAARESVTRSLG